MSEFAKYLHQFKNTLLNSVTTNYSAIVLAYDESSRTATIQPQMRVNGTSYSELHNIPIVWQCYKVNGGAEQEYVPHLQPGDVVYCAVSMRSLDKADTKQQYDAGASRIMNLQDSVILGVLY